ncbi:MAG: hypothetical protein PVG65_00740 [Candidatus Thorarchaeota archaeon]
MKGALKTTGSKRFTGMSFFTILFLISVFLTNPVLISGNTNPRLLDYDLHYCCKEYALHIWLSFQSEEKTIDVNVFLPDQNQSCNCKVIQRNRKIFATGVIQTGNLRNGEYESKIIVNTKNNEIIFIRNFDVNCTAEQNNDQQMYPFAQNTLNDLNESIVSAKETLSEAEKYELIISQNLCIKIQEAEEFLKLGREELSNKRPIAANNFGLEGIKILENLDELKNLETHLSLPNLSVELYCKEEYYVGEEVTFSFSIKNSGNSDCKAYYRISYDGMIDDGKIDLSSGEIISLNTKPYTFNHSKQYEICLSVECQRCKEITLEDNEETKEILPIKKIELDKKSNVNTNSSEEAPKEVLEILAYISAIITAIISFILLIKRK